MKFFSTFFIALFLFGLCLVEKQLKRRALEAQDIEEDFVKNPNEKNSQDRISEAAFAHLPSDQTGLFVPKLQFNDISAYDSTSVFHEANLSVAKQL